jgi:hypothetical protein
LVVLLIATPSVLLPSLGPDAKQIVTLIAIFGAAFTIFEYASAYPGLVEFRDAPPFNRIRFLSLFLTVLLLTIICRGLSEPTTLSAFLTAIGGLIGIAVDFPYSPVRLVLLMMPDGSSADHLNLVRTCAGMSYLISLLSLGWFLVTVRLRNWPTANGSFNVWINLPTFDPTAGKDVVHRLDRDARINIALGFLLPFLLPAAVKAAAVLFGEITLANPQTLIWTVTAWAFLPASLFMRGIAMGRVARMIAAKREQAYANAKIDDDVNIDRLPAHS